MGKNWLSIIGWRKATTTVAPRSVKSLPSFLRPGMGGTTIAHPEALDILRAIFDGSMIGVVLNDPDQISGKWTVNPDACDINDTGTEIRIHVVCQGKRVKVTVPIEGMVECDPGAYGHTLFEIPSDGTKLKEERGFACFRSPEPKGTDHKRIILVWPQGGGMPRVPKT